MKHQLQKFALYIAAAGLFPALAIGQTVENRVEPWGDLVGPPPSRACVVAELREAQRLGLITVGEEDIRLPTAEQARLIAKAGERADAGVPVANK